ncbi:MAG: hypothetical protein OXI61_20245 [Candidatus Poribacteria bacterium]|nr:hypothetical protein [Candidatus Poribacteria bacterium]MDE0690499.1 hypothetical protein [Candidatus Poribacteria bacterium]
MNDYQQHPTAAEAHLMAEQESEFDAKKITWFFIGLFGNIIGVLIASIYEPTPPASRLLERSPEYIALYTDSYKAKSRSIQLRQSLIGLVVPVVFMILWVILLGILI